MATRIISGWKEIPTTASGNVPVEQATTPWIVEVEGISIISFYTEGSITSAAAPGPNTIVTQAFVATTFENIVLVQCSGTNYAKYTLRVNGVIISTKRSGPTYNVEFDFTGAPFALTTGDVVTVVEEHTSGSLDFEATIFGYA